MQCTSAASPDVRPPALRAAEGRQRRRLRGRVRGVSPLGLQGAVLLCGLAELQVSLATESGPHLGCLPPEGSGCAAAGSRGAGRGWLCPVAGHRLCRGASQLLPRAEVAATGRRTTAKKNGNVRSSPSYTRAARSPRGAVTEVSRPLRRGRRGRAEPGGQRFPAQCPPMVKSPSDRTRRRKGDRGGIAGSPCGPDGGEVAGRAPGAVGHLSDGHTGSLRRRAALG